MANEGVRRSALVTGATSGIGAAFAERLAADGYDLILHGRRAAQLEEAAARLRSSHGIEARVVTADLALDAERRKVEDIVAEDVPLHVLINNAGFTPLLPFEGTPLAEIEAMIAVHVLALTRLTRLALPKMLGQRDGIIVNVATDGIFVPYPRSLMATYAATKAYVETFTRAIAGTAREGGVRVQALCPGFVTSDILSRHGVAFEDWGIPPEAVMSARTCVDVSMAALELGEVTCVPTLESATLLDELQSIRDRIRAESSGTRIPGSRYHLNNADGLPDA